MRRLTQWLVLLWFCLSSAWAAQLQFTASSNGSPAAMPLVKVTVSGVEVYNNRSSALNIPINTTGHVVISILELPDYQQLLDWTGVCAGTIAGSCEFDAGQPITYTAGINVKNLYGTVRFTSSSTDAVRAPDLLSLTIASGPNEVGSASSPNIPAWQTYSLVIGQYGLQVNTLLGNDSCYQSGLPATLNARVSEGLETVVDVKYRADRCIVNANVLPLTRGSVVSTPAGIDCPNGVIAIDSPSSCAAFFAYKQKVKLFPSANPGFVFSGWATGCVALDPTCEVEASPAAAKTATFAPASAGSADLSINPLSYSVADAGSGRVKISFTIKNNGLDSAVATRAQIYPTEFGAFSEIPLILSDGGACNAVFVCTWSLGDLASGQSKTVSLSAASSKTVFTLRSCSLSTTSDAVAGDNCATGTATLGGNPPPPAQPVNVGLGSSNPTDAAILKGSSGVTALQFSVAPQGNADALLTGLTVAVSGSGLDTLDIPALHVYADLNGNGLKDSGDVPLVTGAFLYDNGSLSSNFDGSAIGATSQFLVTLDFNSSIAGSATQTGLAMAAVALVLCGSRRRWWGALGAVLAISLTACPNPPAPSAVTRTYQVTLSALTVSRSGEAATIIGLPVTGRVLSVQK